MEPVKAEVESSAPKKDLRNIINDIESALSHVKKTLAELDQALSNVEQTLNGVEEALGDSGATPNEATTIPHSQYLYDPVAQAAVESALAVVEEQDHDQLYDPAFVEYGPSTGDTLQWYRDQGDRDLGEAMDCKRLARPSFSNFVDEELLRRESDRVGSSGYSADDEESPPMGKGFEG